MKRVQREQGEDSAYGMAPQDINPAEFAPPPEADGQPAEPAPELQPEDGQPQPPAATEGAIEVPSELRGVLKKLGVPEDKVTPEVLKVAKSVLHGERHMSKLSNEIKDLRQTTPDTPQESPTEQIRGKIQEGAKKAETADQLVDVITDILAELVPAQVKSAVGPIAQQQRQMLVSQIESDFNARHPEALELQAEIEAAVEENPGLARAITDRASGERIMALVLDAAKARREGTAPKPAPATPPSPPRTTPSAADFGNRQVASPDLRNEDDRLIEQHHQTGDPAAMRALIKNRLAGLKIFDSP